jgi:hypothetical protein
MGCVAPGDKYSNKATDWTVRRFRSLYVKEIILFSKSSRLAAGPAYKFYSMASGSPPPPFPGGKWPGREIIHSASPRAEFKNNWRYSCPFSACVHVMDKEKLYCCSRRRLIEIFAFGRRWVFHRVSSDRSEKLT